MTQVEVTFSFGKITFDVLKVTSVFHNRADCIVLNRVTRVFLSQEKMLLKFSNVDGFVKPITKTSPDLPDAW